MNILAKIGIWMLVSCGGVCFFGGLGVFAYYTYKCLKDREYNVGIFGIFVVLIMLAILTTFTGLIWMVK